MYRTLKSKVGTPCFISRILAAIFICSIFYSVSNSQVSNVPNIISYQGQITGSDGIPLTGDQLVTISLYGDPHSRKLVWQGKYILPVSNGIFNVLLGKGDYPLPGSDKLNRALWVGIQVGGSEEMKPLTQLAGVPYAMNVPDHSITSDKLAMDVLLGMHSGNTPTIQATPNWTRTLDAYSRTNATPDYLGTNASGGDLEIRTQNEHAVRYLFTSSGAAPNIIGGYSGNTITGGDAGSVITGGGKSSSINSITTSGVGYSFIGGGEKNTITGGHSVISGGTQNSASGGVIGGGYGNTTSGESVVGGGQGNTSSGSYSAVLGGEYNQATGWYTVVGGGYNNLASGDGSVVAGGNPGWSGGGNIASGKSSVVSGGARNKASGVLSVVSGGGSVNYTIPISNLASGDTSVVSGGSQNTASGTSSVVSGGLLNTASHIGSVVAGGGDQPAHGFTLGNTASGDYSVVSGGKGNVASGTFSVVAGGGGDPSTDGGTGWLNNGNVASGNGATVTGGVGNLAAGNGSVVGGEGSLNTTGHFNVICGGLDNTCNANNLGSNTGEAFVGGGQDNAVNGGCGVVVGGSGNTANGKGTFMGSGITAGLDENNTANADNAVIVGGELNTLGLDADHTKSKNCFIGGGELNLIGADPTLTFTGMNADHSVIVGGELNKIASEASSSVADHSIIGGGFKNVIKTGGRFASIPAGDSLVAQSYAQVVIGHNNIPQGTSTKPTSLPPTSIVVTDRLFIIGNGTPAVGTTPGVPSNAFEVSNNGHSIVYHTNTKPTPAIIGATYADNIIYGWGSVSGAGALTDGFGVNITIVHTPGTGTYLITLNTNKPDNTPGTITSGVVTVALNTASPCFQFIGSTPIVSGSFTVQTTLAAGAPLACSAADIPFMFIVTGRK